MSDRVHKIVAKIFLQGCQTWMKCSEEQIKESPFSKNKILTNFLKILSELFILLWRKVSPELSKL